MKIQILSDLHQEFYDKQIVSKEDMVGDIVLLAGDMTAGSKSIEYIKNYEKPFYYVMGNHEHYGRHWDGCIKDYQAMFKDSNVTVMENDTIVVKNIRIAACTLWTNFYAPMPVTITPAFGVESGMEHQGFFCKEMMSDFSTIKGITISGWEERYKNSVKYLETILSQKHEGPTVVLTHHAPSFKSSHPKYENSAIKGGFCSNLEYLMEEYQPEIWFHGHCHESFDYMIDKTRVICNPRGYRSENASGYKRQLIVEL